jgi:hypothetical protein
MRFWEEIYETPRRKIRNLRRGGWGDIGEQVSRGSDRRRPPWRQPRDRRVPPPPATVMHLNQPRMNQGAINLSAPCSGYLSLRWIRAMAQNLLCACVFSSTNDFGIMNCTRCIGSFILPWSNPPEDDFPPSCSFATYPSLLCFSLHCVSDMPRQRGKSKRGSAWQPSRPRLAIAPRLHPPTTLHPHLPPRHPPCRSQATASTTSRPSPHLLHAGWSGLISPKILWDLTQVPSKIWPPLRSQFPVAPPNSPAYTPTQSPPARPHCAQTQSDGYEASHGLTTRASLLRRLLRQLCI